MTRSKLSELISESAILANEKGEDPLLTFASTLLFHCAKMVCFNCKNGNPSEETRDPNVRIHRLGNGGYTEACRAPQFFLEKD